jgi:hypothetical protein
MQVQYVLHLLPCTHQDDIRLHAKHSATKANQFLQSPGGSFSKFLLNSRWTVIADFFKWNSSTQNAFSSWVVILHLCCTLVARVEITSYACLQYKLFELLFAMVCVKFLCAHYLLTNKFIQPLTSFVITLYNCTEYLQTIHLLNAFFVTMQQCIAP